MAPIAAMICSENWVACAFMLRELSAARAVSSDAARTVSSAARISSAFAFSADRGVDDGMHAELGGLLELARHVRQVRAAVGLALAFEVDQHEIAPVLLAQQVGQPVDAGQQPLDLAARRGGRCERRIQLGARDARRSSSQASASGRASERPTA